MQHCARFRGFLRVFWPYTVLKVIDFPRNNTKCSGENEILRGIFRVQNCSLSFSSTVHFVLYLGNLDYVLDSVEIWFLPLPLQL